MTIIEKTFQEAICTEVAQFGDTITCGCEQVYQHPAEYGTFAGIVIVKGCGCAASSSFAGLLWGHRHAVARFLRGMGEALRMDVAEVEAVLPAGLGEERE